ncbi:hypothetical protein [uncultured Tateyamaria sp.]|uniref:hypothetical protein n=1 Tax=uncultured Tateyamaria sp. TaxID=455651 RepID=UPI002620D4D8|nr:hypothetical protein [uncultured Tateyamaria sp.]
MSTELVRNAPVRAEYGMVLKALKPVLHDLPAIIVVIDGRVGSGKTTLGRFLAWRFNITLIETDLFMHRNKGKFTYRNDHVAEIIKERMASDRPVLVEGVVALRLLEDLCLTHAFHVHLICDESEGSSITELEWNKYDAKYQPSAKADLSLCLPPLT